MTAGRWSSTVLIFCVGFLTLLGMPRSAPAAESATVGVEHWVSSVSAANGQPLKLYVWEKRARSADVGQFAATRKVVVLAPSSTTPARVLYDFQPEGTTGAGLSLMDYLAERGFDVFTLEYQNYGRSDKHECGFCVNTQVAANDIAATVDYVRKLRGVDRVYLAGWAWGSMTTGLFTMQQPDKVQRLALSAVPVWSGPRDTPPPAEFRRHTIEAARGLFEPNVAEPGVVDIFARRSLESDPRIPNGVVMDLRTKMPLTDPRQIVVPTMIVMAERDQRMRADQPELPAYFAALPNPDKQLIVVPGVGHLLMLHAQRLRFYTELAKWFSLEGSSGPRP